MGLCRIEVFSDSPPKVKIINLISIFFFGGINTTFTCIIKTHNYVYILNASKDIKAAVTFIQVITTQRKGDR